MRRSHRAQRTPDPSLTPLFVRAGATRTLGSSLTIFAITLLGVGAYLLVEVMRHPLDAQPTEIIAGAVMIALAATMLFYLFEPGTSVRSAHHRRVVELPSGVQSLPTPLICVLPLADAQSELPFGPTLAKRTSAGD